MATYYYIIDNQINLGWTDAVFNYILVWHANIFEAESVA